MVDAPITSNDEQIAPVPRLALDREQTAKAMHISVRKLDSITYDPNSGIPFVRFNRSVRYPTQALIAWLNEQAGRGGKHDT